MWRPQTGFKMEKFFKGGSKKERFFRGVLHRVKEDFHFSVLFVGVAHFMCRFLGRPGCILVRWVLMKERFYIGAVHCKMLFYF
ncbi:unnamed protein product [Ixodes pacificus]